MEFLYDNFMDFLFGFLILMGLFFIYIFKRQEKEESKSKKT